MKNKELFSIGWKDAVKGFILAMITMIVTMVMSSINNGEFPDNWTEWKTILIASLGSALAYLLKNWLTSSDDKFLKKEDPNK